MLLHGFSQTGDSWAPVREALGHDAPAPDLRGHGRAAALRPVSFGAVLSDLDLLVPDGAVLAGYSMGGRIALRYALERPGRVGRLVLISAGPGLADPGARTARAAADARLADRVEHGPIERFADEWSAQPLFAGQPPEVARAARVDRLRNTPAGLAAALRGLGTGTMQPMWSRLGGVSVPVTLVVGETDAKFGAIAREMAVRLPDAEVLVVPGAGHAVHLEQPGAVARILGVAQRLPGVRLPTRVLGEPGSPHGPHEAPPPLR